MTERYDTNTNRGLDQLDAALEEQHIVAGLREAQFRTDAYGNRLMSVDLAYRRNVEALYRCHYGTTRRNHNGQPVDSRGRRL